MWFEYVNININVERIERMKFRFRHNKSYIDQASSVRMVEVWPRSNAKKTLARIQLS